MRAVVLALADLGKSARMQYHARSFAASGLDVDLVGFEGTALSTEIEHHPQIAVHRLANLTTRHRQTNNVTYVIAAVFDVLMLSLRLWRILAGLRAPDVVLVQNPPTIPTMAVAWWTLKRRRNRFIVDWHNLWFTTVRQRLGRWHPVVRFVRWYERRHARRVDANLCVSRGMAAWLETRFGTARPTVLYDRPGAVFTPIERIDRDRFKQTLFGRLGVPLERNALIVCPTSWTEDEDFDLVVDAVYRLEDRIRGWEAAAPGRRFANLVVLVTGDGGRRKRFERLFAGLPARRVQLRTRWLEPEEYPRVVGSADLGLCLHRSSSGLDIPMKVADLFGAAVPVLALDYGACLAERVRHGDNGLLFSTGRQLADVLFDLFEGYPADQTTLDRLRAGAARSARPAWDEGWNRDAKSFLLPHAP